MSTDTIDVYAASRELMSSAADKLRIELVAIDKARQFIAEARLLLKPVNSQAAHELNDIELRIPSYAESIARGNFGNVYSKSLEQYGKIVSDAILQELQARHGQLLRK